MTPDLPDRGMWTAAHVSRFFGHADTTWFYRRRAALRKKGFPEPLFGQSWDPLAILAWRLQQMRPDLRVVAEALCPPPPTDNGLPSETEWAQRLDAKAAALGQAAE